MKKIAVFLFFLSLCIILILSSYWIVNNQLIDNQVSSLTQSIQQKNLNTFTELINIKSLSKNLVDGYRIAEHIKSSHDNQNSDEPIKTIISLKNTIIDVMYEKFNEDIEVLIINFLLNKNDETSSLIFDTEEIVLFLKNIDWDSIKVTKKINLIDSEAQVNISVNNYLIKDNIGISLKLKKETFFGKWKIVEATDFYKTMIDYHEKKDQAIAKFNININKEMGNIIQLIGYETKTFTYFEGFGHSTKHKIELKNISNQYVHSIKVRIWVYTYNGDLVEKIVEDRRGIQPNESLKIHVQNFDPNFSYEMNINQNYPKMEVIEVNLGKYILKYIDDFKADLNF